MRMHTMRAKNSLDRSRRQKRASTHRDAPIAFCAQDVRGAVLPCHEITARSHAVALVFPAAWRVLFAAA
jgi:hypothetical protein